MWPHFPGAGVATVDDVSSSSTTSITQGGAGRGKCDAPAAAATQRLRKVLTVTSCRCVHANTSSPDAFSRRIDTANPFASADAAEDTKWRVMELNY